MNTNLSKAFEEEFLSFFALYLVNLVLAALTMALGLAIVVQQLVPAAGGVPALPTLLVLLAGTVAFVLGLVWITATAKLLKSIKVVRKAYKEKKKREMSPEDVTGMMVHMMIQYRDQKKMIRAMVTICIAGGICYLLLGISNLISALAPLASSLPVPFSTATIIALIAAAINLTIGAGCIQVSRYFRRYARVWDERLDALARSEGELGLMLERT
jgi:hypothetical protein